MSHWIDKQDALKGQGELREEDEVRNFKFHDNMCPIEDFEQMEEDHDKEQLLHAWKENESVHWSDKSDDKCLDGNIKEVDDNKDEELDKDSNCVSCFIWSVKHNRSALE